MKSMTLAAALLLSTPACAATFEVHAPDSLPAAIEQLRKQGPGPHTLMLHGGTYHLAQPLQLTAADSGLTLMGAPGEQVILSGSQPLTLNWTPYKNGIQQAIVPADVTAIDQLWVDGEPHILARYPNADPAVQTFHGYAADAIDPQRVKRWSDPVGGIIHAMHRALWGSQEYVITGKDDTGKLTYEGGYQTNRPAPMHREFRFVENIFEELDAPREFYFNPRTHTLYDQPPEGTNLSQAAIEVNRAETLIDIHGESAQAPATHITLQHLTFTHTDRTFMKTREPLLQSDWCVARTGALLVTNTEDLSVDHCTFVQLGGTAIFISNYNNNDTVTGCHIHDIGASGVLVTGDPAAVRSPRTGYAAPLPEKMDLTPGPLTNNYPRNCTISNCLIHDIGDVEKQVAGVGIDMASHITVSHCSIYSVPRSGINIGEGCFGGHLVEGCDVFDTVRETGDHGSFNSWGRDRFWSPDRKTINTRVAANPALPGLDVLEPITLRNNRWRCDHGWDVDLDDGSSNYLIENNLFLHGGLKFREGYNRIARNNIFVNCTFHPHVWLEHSHDVLTHNILFRPYRPIGMPKAGSDWGDKVDENFFTDPSALAAVQKLGVDAHSIAGDPQLGADFRPQNPTLLAWGFGDFPTTFGVTDPALRPLARTPAIDPPVLVAGKNEDKADATITWLGAKAKSVTTDGEVSAAGLPEKSGVLLLEVPDGSPAAAKGLQKLDVLLGVNGKPVRTVADLPKQPITTLQVFRRQAELHLESR